MSAFANMAGTEFEGAGLAEGVEVWRMQKRKLIRAEAGGEESTGTFYDKECYLILHTVPKKSDGGFQWYIHTLKGSSASMIVSGFAGSMANKLNNLLLANANPRDVTVEHHKQGTEGRGLVDAFHGAALQFKEGTAQGGTGFAQQATKRVRHVKLTVQIDGVFVRLPARREMLSSDKTFVMDGAGEVFSWSGSKCGRIERAISEEVARRILAREYKTVGEVDVLVTHIIEGASSEGEDRFLALLDREAAAQTAFEVRSVFSIASMVAHPPSPSSYFSQLHRVLLHGTDFLWLRMWLPLGVSSALLVWFPLDGAGHGQRSQPSLAQGRPRERLPRDRRERWWPGRHLTPSR